MLNFAQRVGLAWLAGHAGPTKPQPDAFAEYEYHQCWLSEVRGSCLIAMKWCMVDFGALHTLI